MAKQIILVRHGETEWSANGRHTGRTDIPLTEIGTAEATAVGARFEGLTFDGVYSSPLLRARMTAQLAGRDPSLHDDLVEWDYGTYEGLTNEMIVADRPGWSKWHHGVPSGESADDVGERADRFLRDLDPDAASVAVFAHGHLLAIMIARWLGLEANEGRRFPLSTGTVSILAWKRSDPILQLLNSPCDGGLGQ